MKTPFYPGWPWPLTLTFKLIRVREQPNTSFVWICRKSVGQFPRYLPKTPFLSVVNLIFGLVWVRDQTYLLQISSAIPEISAENSVICSWWPWPLTFKFVWARDQAHLPCEYGANLFTGKWDISYTNKKVTDSTKNRTLHSSTKAVFGHLLGLFLQP